VDEEILLVRFEGGGAGSDELAWGQASFWYCMRDTGQSATMGGVAPVPAGTTVGELAELLGYLLSRHQSLRTRLEFGPDGQVRQVCSASGEVPLRVVEAGQDDPAPLADRICQEFAERNFDYRTEWPLRMAVITQHGLATHVVAMYLHLALDAGGLAALLADLADRDRPTSTTARPITALTPLQQARRQRSAAARRQSAAALRHLEQVMRGVRPAWFGAPRVGGEATFRMIRYRSPATALAIGRIATHQGVDAASAMLAMFAVGMARYTGDNPVAAMLMVSNRFRPGFADSVSSVVQISPYLIDVAGISLAEAVTRAGRSLLHTYKNAYFDPGEQEKLVFRLSRELGRHHDFCCFYNDRGQDLGPAAGATAATDEQLRHALARGSWAWEHQADMSTRKLFVSVDSMPDAVELVMSADSRYFAADDLPALAATVEAAAVQAAVEPSASAWPQSHIEVGGELRAVVCNPRSVLMPPHYQS